MSNYIRIVHIIFTNLHYLSKTLVSIEALDVNRRMLKISISYDAWTATAVLMALAARDTSFLMEMKLDGRKGS